MEQGREREQLLGNVTHQVELQALSTIGTISFGDHETEMLGGILNSVCKWSSFPQISASHI